MTGNRHRRLPRVGTCKQRCFEGSEDARRCWNRIAGLAGGCLGLTRQMDHQATTPEPLECPRTRLLVEGVRGYEWPGCGPRQQTPLLDVAVLLFEAVCGPKGLSEPIYGCLAVWVLQRAPQPNSDRPGHGRRGFRHKRRSATWEPRKSGGLNSRLICGARGGHWPLKDQASGLKAKAEAEGGETIEVACAKEPMRRGDRVPGATGGGRDSPGCPEEAAR